VPHSSCTQLNGPPRDGQQGLATTQDLQNFCKSDAVKDLPALGTIPYKPALLQARQVARDVALRAGERLDQIGHTTLARAQFDKDRQPSSIRETGEELGCKANLNRTDCALRSGILHCTKYRPTQIHLSRPIFSGASQWINR